MVGSLVVVLVERLHQSVQLLDVERLFVAIAVRAFGIEVARDRVLVLQMGAKLAADERYSELRFAVRALRALERKVLQMTMQMVEQADVFGSHHEHPIASRMQHYLTLLGHELGLAVLLAVLQREQRGEIVERAEVALVL